MPGSLIIRTASTADLAAVNRVLVETWHDTYDSLLGRDKVDAITGRWHAIDVLARQLVAPHSSFLVSEIDRQIVGHAFASAQQVPVLTVSRLYVLPAYQRRRAGEKMLAALLADHPDTTLVRLNVEAENAKALGFYRKQGFDVVGEATEDGVKVLRMEKRIVRDI